VVSTLHPCQRINRAWQTLEREVAQNRTGQTFRVDLQHLFRGEEFIKPRTEMATAFHDQRPEVRGLKAQMLEIDRVGALLAVAGDDDRYPADPQGCRPTQIHTCAGNEPATPDHVAVAQSDDLRIGGKRLSKTV
jgi:hypothetical protein